MQVFGLIGNPVGHSLSPPMHEAAYEALGMDARYVTFEPDPDEITRAVDGAAALGIAGLNVTIPFKQDVLDHPAAADHDLAEAEQGPDHGRLARIQAAMHDLEGDAGDEALTAIEAANDAINDYREGLEGV